MKVFLLKDVKQVGIANEMLEVSDGYAKNFLFPQKLAVQITSANEGQYVKRVKKIEHRKEVITHETSMLAEKINGVEITLKHKINDQGKLFGAINQHEVSDALAKKGISVSKSQIVFDKMIKAPGKYEVTVKLSSRLQPVIKVNVVSE